MSVIGEFCVYEVGYLQDCVSGEVPRVGAQGSGGYEVVRQPGSGEQDFF